MQLDLSAEHVAWDNTEAVALESADRPSADVVSIGLAKRRSVRGREKSPSGGAYVGYELTWHIPARFVPPGIRPKPGDAIVDGDGRRWTVLTVDLMRAGERWQLGTVDLELALGLRHVIDLERAEILYTPAGAPLKRFPSAPPESRGGRVLHANLPARVQLATEEVTEDRAVRAWLRTYQVWVAKPVPDLVEDDRIRWVENGQALYLDVVSVRNPERIDELWMIEAEHRP
jgi:hypothetical protein